MWQGFAMAGNERLSGCAYVVEPLLAVEKYPGRTPEQEEFRKGLELAN